MAAVTTPSPHFQGKENVILQQAAQTAKTEQDVTETVKSGLASLCALMKLVELLPTSVRQRAARTSQEKHMLLSVKVLDIDEPCIFALPSSWKSIPPPSASCHARRQPGDARRQPEERILLHF
jgi:hypothetical protein